jgi:Protein of unknown function (DUF565)
MALEIVRVFLPITNKGFEMALEIVRVFFSDFIWNCCWFKEIFSTSWIRVILDKGKEEFQTSNPTQMQNTRLSMLITTISRNTEAWFLNPWRRISLIIINLLLGFFLGAAISTGAGQRAEWDITAAGILVFFTEICSRIFYSRGLLAKRSLWVESLNCLKIGIIYSLFLEAFKLGS